MKQPTKAVKNQIPKRVTVETEALQIRPVGRPKGVKYYKCNCIKPKPNNKLYCHPEGTDPVYDKEGKLITHLSFKTMRAMMRKKIIEIKDYQYHLTTIQN